MDERNQGTGRLHALWTNRGTGNMSFYWRFMCETPLKREHDGADADSFKYLNQRAAQMKSLFEADGEMMRI